MATIIIRADANDQIGMGHLVRCLDFASYASEKGFNAEFLTSTITAKEKIETKGFKCININTNYQDILIEMKNLSSNHNPIIMLLDINYCSTVEQRHAYFNFLKELDRLHLFLITFEDMSTEVYPADIVIIPYAGAESLKLQKEEGSQYLLGPKYFPIRKDYYNMTNKKYLKNVENILITMGGSDPNQITIKVVKALTKLKLNAHLIVVLGSLSKISNKQIETLLSNYGGSFEVIKDAKYMPKLMNKSQLAITNSGLTKYEMANMELPAIVISNNSKHAKLMDDFSSYGTAVHLGNSDTVTEEKILSACTNLIKDKKKRKEMSIAGKRLVDGKGIERIFNCITREYIYV